MSSLYLNIRRVREFKNYTQEYVASKLGISQASYSNLENGKIKISSGKLKQIAAVLDVEEKTILNLTLFNRQLIENNEWSQVTNNLTNLIFLYERLLKQKNEEIEFLKKLLK
jgi:transcriptional regulator with XRE-family HTH domain